MEFKRIHRETGGGSPGNLWEPLKWLRLRFLPQMPCEEGLDTDASGVWQPSVEGKGSFQLLPKTKEKHCWAGSSPALAYSLMGAVWKGNLFPMCQPVSPCPWICWLSPSNSASLLPLTPSLPSLSAILDPSPQAVVLTCPFLLTGCKWSAQPKQKPNIWILQ